MPRLLWLGGDLAATVGAALFLLHGPTKCDFRNARRNPGMSMRGLDVQSHIRLRYHRR